MKLYYLHHKTSDTWPYNRFIAPDDKGLELCEKLGDILPHGSGINGTWDITTKDNKTFHAANTYEAMNENGFYCHNYSFTAIYKYNGKNATEKCPICNDGKRLVTEIAKIWDVHPMIAVEQLVTDHNTQVYWNDGGNVESAYFLCWGCQGKGYLPLHEYQLVKINFHGQRERQCCAYGLVDYLFQTCEYLGDEN